MRWAVIVVTLVFVGNLSVTVGVGPAGAAQDCSFPVTMTDGTGTEVTVGAEPFRVVTLNPSAAQIMWEIGARNKVVGLTKYAEYLDGADARTVVSTNELIVSIERVVALEPELVLAPHATSNETIEQLRDAGLTVYYFDRAETIDDVYRKVRTVGRLTGACPGAEATVDWMQARLDVVDAAVSGQERPDVLYHFFGYTAGEGTFINEVIQRAGGNNIATDVNISWYQPINDEVVVARDPEWLILTSNDPEVPKTAAFNGTTAVQEGQVVVLPVQHLNQPAPRIVYAVTTLAQHFHPEAYAAANATVTPTATATTVTITPSPQPTEQQSDTSTVSTDTTTPGQPGFGTVALLLAGVALVLGRRRLA